MHEGIPTPCGPLIRLKSGAMSSHYTSEDDTPSRSDYSQGDEITSEDTTTVSAVCMKGYLIAHLHRRLRHLLALNNNQHHKGQERYANLSALPTTFTSSEIFASAWYCSAQKRRVYVYYTPFHRLTTGFVHPQGRFLIPMRTTPR